METAVTVPLCSAGNCANRWPMSTMFKAPTRPYTKPVADKKRAEEIRLMVTYLTAPSSWVRSPCMTSKTNEVMSINSNQTKRLNKSPVRNAPETPISNSW